MTVYAIPDIHGYADELDRAHDLVATDRAREGTASAPLVHLGDLGDRGPDTRGVFDRLVAGMARDEPWVVLLGNHDRMFLNFLMAGGTRDGGLPDDEHWLHPNLGGRETLASYGVDTRAPFAQIRAAAAEAVPNAHRDFLRDRPLWHEAGPLLFVHAGLRPGVPLHRQTEDDLIWIRTGFLDDATDHGRLVVHGHTVVEEPTHFGNRVALDAGAGYGRPLVAAVFEDRRAWRLTPSGRVPLAAARQG